MESFIPVNGTAGNSAPVVGGRRHKLKLVTRKAARKMLKKLGAKMRGGADDAPGAVVAEAPKPAAGGRRKSARGGKKGRSASRKASLGKMFGL